MSSILNNLTGSKEPFTLRWGILGAGKISGTFVRDLVLDPKTRGTTDVAHKLVAVGSRDAAKAREFADANAPHVKDIKFHGTYEGLVADSNVDAIYIGVPHTHHYTAAALCLKAKKHVLLEKPATSNAAELRSLIKIAKENNVFLMEAMWTRFTPVAEEVYQLVSTDKLGPVRLLQADLSGDFHLENIEKTHRILDPHLGGGGLLDLGPYPFVWLIIALYEYPKNKFQRPTSTTGSLLKTPLTGVDQNAVIVLNFDHIDAQAILSTSINLPSPSPTGIIRCANGNIIIDAPLYKPPSITIQEYKPGTNQVVREEKRHYKIEGGGWHYQADHVARCVRDGKIESPVWGWDKSLFQMDTFDEVRRQGGYVLPAGVEKVLN